MADMNTNFLPDRDTIIGLIEAARKEFADKGGRLPAVGDCLVQRIMDRIAKEKKAFRTRQECLGHCRSVVRKELRRYAGMGEGADEIINKLKSGDKEYIRLFFYENNCRIRGLRSKIIGEIRRTYNVDVSKEEFGNILYTHLWDNGTWGVLDSYSGKGSFFKWLEKLAWHEVMKVLEDMGCIKASRARTPGNTRLVGKSVGAARWEVMLADMMPNGLHKDMLTAVYVDRKSEARMMRELSLGADRLRDIIKKAETRLKDVLIRNDNPYAEEFLRDKSPRIVEVEEEYAADGAKSILEDMEKSPLSDVLGVNLGRYERDRNVVDFLYWFSGKMKWSDEDRLIWTQRFIENVSPLDVAKRLGRERSWLDTRYSRLNKHFGEAIRKWWKNNAT